MSSVCPNCNQAVSCSSCYCSGVSGGCANQEIKIGMRCMLLRVVLAVSLQQPAGANAATAHNSSKPGTVMPGNHLLTRGPLVWLLLV
jgi:hypothetical protein